MLPAGVLLVLLVLIGQCSGEDTPTAATTETATVTTTVTVTETAAPVVAPPLTVTETAPAAAPPPPAPGPTGRPEETAPAAFYENCSDVRAAGAAPIRAGDPGYSRDLDRDGDGVGCES